MYVLFISIYLFIWEFARKSADQLRVRLGEHDFGRATGAERDHRVQLILLHENYNGQTFLNDIALIKLKTAVKKYNETIRPVCLPPVDLDLVERATHITGKITLNK